MIQDKQKLSVTKPCNKIWEEMKPTEEGRFCNSCEKSVIDFTRMTDLEITDFFIQRKSGSTCGRFYNTQLERVRIHIPTYIFQRRMNSWKKYLLIVFICFGSQLFSVDINFGFNKLYAQTKQDGKSVKLNKNNHYKKKLKVRSNKSRFDHRSINEDFSTMTTLGEFRPTPENKIVINTDSISILKSEVSQGKDESISNINYDTKTGNKSKSPEKERSSQNNFEFIIPPFISIRKFIKKVKSFNTSH